MLMKHQFFSSFTTLVLSPNYVTKRQSLKLLGEILLDRANFSMPPPSPVPLQYL
jgi:hypothetical protein